MSDINIQELDKSKIYLVTVPDDYGKKEIHDILEGFKAKRIECLVASKDLVISEYKGFPEITLPEGSSELVDKAIQEAEKKVAESKGI